MLRESSNNGLSKHRHTKVKICKGSQSSSSDGKSENHPKSITKTKLILLLFTIDDDLANFPRKFEIVRVLMQVRAWRPCGTILQLHCC